VLGVLGESDSVARPRHPVSGDSGQPLKSIGVQQKSADSPGNHKGSNPGTANPTAGASVGDKGSNQNSRGPRGDGPMKRGQGLPGRRGTKTGGKPAKGDVGKNQGGELGSGNHQGAVRARTNAPGTDAIRTDNVIVERPGGKPKKPVVDTAK